MALITINEAKRQRPSIKEVPLSVKQLEQMMPEIRERIESGESAFQVLDRLSFVDERLKNTVRGERNSIKALEKIYNYILFAEGDGVLKEYHKKVCRFKGTAIGGMECHSH